MKVKEYEVLPSRFSPLRVTPREGKDYFDFLTLMGETRQLEVCEYVKDDWAGNLPNIVAYLGEDETSAFLYDTQELEVLFQELVGEWETDTEFLSDLGKVVLHPAYQSMIGLGPQVIHLILREMPHRPLEWFWALRALTRENPAELCSGFQQITNAWLEWGKQKEYI